MSDSSDTSTSSSLAAPPAISVVYTPEPTMEDGGFRAEVLCDLRHSDAHVLNSAGRVFIQTGGTFDGQVVPVGKTQVYADLVLSKVLASLDGAREWQDRIASQVIDGVRAMRTSYAEAYPEASWERYVSV